MATATLNGSNSYTVTDVVRGVPVKMAYPLAVATCDYITEGGQKRLTLYHLGVATIALSDISGAHGYGNTIFGSTNPTTALSAVESAIGVAAGGGGGGGGGGTTAAVIEAGVVAANTSGNAETLTPTTRLLTTNATGATTGGSKTIAANARGYQIIAVAGSFSLDDGTGVSYSSTSALVGVSRSVVQGFRYPAIVITPSNNSQVFIEELR